MHLIMRGQQNNPQRPWENTQNVTCDMLHVHIHLLNFIREAGVWSAVLYLCDNSQETANFFSVRFPTFFHIPKRKPNRNQ